MSRIKLRKTPRVRPKAFSLEFHPTPEVTTIRDSSGNALRFKFPDIAPPVFTTLLNQHQQNPDKVEEFLLYYGWKGDGQAWTKPVRRKQHPLRQFNGQTTLYFMATKINL
jgi:hypothetical protein